MKNLVSCCVGGMRKKEESRMIPGFFLFVFECVCVAK